jgi:hypothetical protein
VTVARARGCSVVLEFDKLPGGFRLQDAEFVLGNPAAASNAEARINYALALAERRGALRMREQARQLVLPKMSSLPERDFLLNLAAAVEALPPDGPS